MTGFLGHIGASAGATFGVAIPSSSLAGGSLLGAQFFFSGSVTGLHGNGLFGAAGYSAVVGANSRALETGTYINSVGQGGAAWGTGGELTAARPLSEPDFSGSFGPRYGGGLYAGTGTQIAGTIAFPQIGCG